MVLFSCLGCLISAKERTSHPTVYLICITMKCCLLVSKKWNSGLSIRYLKWTLPHYLNSKETLQKRLWCTNTHTNYLTAIPSPPHLGMSHKPSPGGLSTRGKEQMSITRCPSAFQASIPVAKSICMDKKWSHYFTHMACLYRHHKKMASEQPKTTIAVKGNTPRR